MQLLTLPQLFAQDDITVFWQPQLALNYNVVKDYSHNFSLANRNFVLQKEELEFSVRQIDLAHFSLLKIKDNQSVALGIMWRNSRIFNSDRVNEIRITQQYNITTTPRSIRFGNRFRAEQRITSLLTVYRFRYRFAIDFPLQGESLDVGESYALWSLENLFNAAKSIKPFYAIRLRGGIGWRLSPGSNLQLSLEYRMEDYTRTLRHVFLLETALNLSM